MQISLIGYGKMGRAIERIAEQRGHSIVAKVDSTEDFLAQLSEISRADVAIEFSVPESAASNLALCAEHGIPVVCGTTGWLAEKDAVIAEFEKRGGSFFYASNYSLGVNLFFALNRYLAGLMNQFRGYEPSIREVHHIHKKDAPSGTALSLAEGILAEHTYLDGWSLELDQLPNQLWIQAERIDEVPGIHSVYYKSPLDQIEIRHEAFSRDSFAEGAVLAAEWLPGKQGIFGMKDFLNL